MKQFKIICPCCNEEIEVNNEMLIAISEETTNEQGLAEVLNELNIEFG